MTTPTAQLDLEALVDKFRAWDRSHNQENYGRYDAFKAGAEAAFNPETCLALIARIKNLEGALKYYAGNFGSDNPDRSADGTKWIDGILVEEDKFGVRYKGRPDIARAALETKGDAK